MAREATDWTTLRRVISGEVLVDGSPGFDAVRRPAIARFHDTVPAAVVRCATAGDVAEAIAVARRVRLPIAVRSGGHCFAGRSSTSGIVIDVGPMDTVTVAAGRATVGAGARLGDVYAALAGHGVTIPAGCGPTVGIAGLTLGGGLGILGRTYGLTADRLRAVQVVLADGRIVDCDDVRHRDLFWALRGSGGGQFGVVTSLVFATVPQPRVTTFHLRWPFADARAVVSAWQAWSPPGPDALAASLLITAPPDVERATEVNVFGGMLDDEHVTNAQLDDLVGLVGADPRSRTHGRRPYAQAKRWLADLGEAMAGAGDRVGATEEPVATYDAGRSEFFEAPLPREAIVAVLASFTDRRVQGQARELDFSPWGGAYNRVPADATAFAHRDELFLLKHAVAVAADAPAADRASAHGWLTRSWMSVRPWGSGRVYPNFPDPDLDEWAWAYHGDNVTRLRRVKSAYDPGGVFRFPQSIPPDTAAGSVQDGARPAP